MHVEMDIQVAAAYGWDDLALEHGYHETAQGLRFTISEAARREVLTRLLKLNHERFAEECRQGLHTTKKGQTSLRRVLRQESADARRFAAAGPNRLQSTCATRYDLLETLTKNPYCERDSSPSRTAVSTRSPCGRGGRGVRGKMLQTPTRLEIREEFVDMIRRELLGPAGGSEEIITEPTVRDRYAVGLLAPLNATEAPYPEDERGPLPTDESDTPEEGHADERSAELRRG